MDELIEDILTLVKHSYADGWTRKYDLRILLETYMEKEIKKRADEHIEEEKEEAWSNGYTQGRKDAITGIREHFEELEEELRYND